MLNNIFRREERDLQRPALDNAHRRGIGNELQGRPYRCPQIPGVQDQGRDARLRAGSLHRLALLARAVRPGSKILIDANETWSAKEAVAKLETIRRAAERQSW
jgi:L-alanine-DL-glutamate epimerase-like enolase superfamily enzyme